MNTIGEIATVLKNINSAVIFTHSSPDGDAIGSALALSYALKKLGKKVQLVNPSPIPACFMCLEGAERFLSAPTLDAESYVALDSSDEARFGDLQSTFKKGANKGKITINIDHHISNTRFCKYNYVNNCSANCENLANIIAEMGVALDKTLATYLMAGLVTDSGGFSHEDVNEATFLIAARLVAAGADVQKVTYELFKKQSLARAKMYTEVISALRFYHENKLAVAIIRNALLNKYNLTTDASTGVVDFALTIEDVEVSVCILEVKKGQYKISFRSKEKTDVNKIAAVFGGGGHIRASGCMLFGEEEEVLERLAYAVSQYLEV